MNRALRSTSTLIAWMTLWPVSASAFRPTDDRARSDVELASGELVRLEREVSSDPGSVALAYRTFVASSPGAWKATFDRHTGAVLRVWGRGIDAPGAVEDAAVAADAARELLARHVDLFAPGASASDFVLAGNDLTDGVRTVGFQQTQAGLRVGGGQVSFRFKHGRMIAAGSEAFGRLDVSSGGRVLNETAILAAKKWIEQDFGGTAKLEGVEGEMIRPAVLQGGEVVAARVVRVIVSTAQPIGRFEVDIDAVSGRPFARRQTLLFASGTLALRVPVRHPAAGRSDFVAQRASIRLNGTAAQTADDGAFSWTSSGAISLTGFASGPLVQVLTSVGNQVSEVFTVEDGGRAVWDRSSDEQADAQLTTFAAARVSRDYMLGIAPNLRFLQERLVATVNIADTCNAFSDGITINFFQSGDGCENTGRLPDVVHHEYGHAIHAHAIIQGAGSFDGALSEGGSDYLSATIANDSGMGRGFFFTNAPLRELDPGEGREWRWPDDRGESHQTGMIIGGALWDLRKALVEKYGEREGVQRADRIWYANMQRASSILTAYVEALVSDDDDGDLSNGTPNMCTITDIFGAHGLADQTVAGPEVGRVQVDGWKISIPVSDDEALCPSAGVLGATLRWDLRGQSGSGARLPMIRVPGAYQVELAPQPEGQVLRYSVELELGAGTPRSFPDNPADPMYEKFLGEVRTIYCTDFEVDPSLEGWAHELVSGGGRRPRDEWEWGTPAPDNASGDPTGAYSGTGVMGTDLGLESFGTYQRDKVEQLMSPTIDLSGATSVRLHYQRWLTIEDGDFDQAEILANGQQVWMNLASGTGEVHHVDKEWRFHDVDLTAAAAQSGGSLQITYRLSSDDGLQLGGWTLDDFCIVAWDGPTARCGDGVVQFGEACDDGNPNGQDGCEADCSLSLPAVCGNGTVELGEQCDDGNAQNGDGCEASCVMTTTGPGTGGDGMLDKAEEGCGCRASGGTSADLSLGFALFGLLLWSRRRRAR